MVDEESVAKERQATMSMTKSSIKFYQGKKFARLNFTYKMRVVDPNTIEIFIFSNILNVQIN